MSNIILSPVGTSILTKDGPRQEINQYSNCRNVEDIPTEAREKIEAHIGKTLDLVMSLSLEEIKIRSAELNGIVQYYQGLMDNAARDTHYLLPSDTYIGKSASGIVEKYLKQYCNDVRVMEIKDLQTKDSDSFKFALSELTGKIMEIKETLYHDQRLIFNLTGGFKSILGFLQSLGMFYADETIYVFEFSESLLNIPPLPVKLVPEKYLQNHTRTFRRLDKELSVNEEECDKIPSSLVLSLFDSPTLSAYGKIVWDNFRREIYSNSLLDSPSDLIHFTNNFIDSVNAENSDKAFYEINRRLDDLAVYLESKRNNMLKSLDLKKLALVQGVSTHEFDAWADLSAKRVFCHFDNGVLILDELRKKLQ
jgi:putative CRISPR-associated protein (TIGR02619 family)